MPQTFLIVPGLHGSGEGHWQRWWQRDHGDSIEVMQADWANPTERWMARLEDALKAYPRSVLVAHSLGAILVARLAGRRSADLVAGALLVAPADIERTSIVQQRTYDFGRMPIGRLPFPSIVVGSRDDVYMDFALVRRLASDWGGQFVDLGYAGHINVASGFGRWTAGYELAASLQRNSTHGLGAGIRQS